MSLKLVLIINQEYSGRGETFRDDMCTLNIVVTDLAEEMKDVLGFVTVCGAR